MKKHGYGYLEEIVVRRADNDLYRFMEGDFPSLRINDIEDMLLFVLQNRVTNLSGDDVFDFALALRMFTRSLIMQIQLSFFFCFFVVAPETSTIAPVISSAAPMVETTLVASPTGLCGLVPYTGSDSDSPDEDPYVVTVPRWRSRVTARPSASHEFPIAPVTAPPGIRRRSATLIRPGEDFPCFALWHAYHRDSQFITLLIPVHLRFLRIGSSSWIDDVVIMCGHCMASTPVAMVMSGCVGAEHWVDVLVTGMVRLMLQK
ncbi:hypothetical protein Tco_0285686 [Tanacetum coccineum]